MLVVTTSSMLVLALKKRANFIILVFTFIPVNFHFGPVEVID